MVLAAHDTVLTEADVLIWSDLDKCCLRFRCENCGLTFWYQPYRLRQCKYLNNLVGQDHRTVKKRVWLAKSYGSFHSAWRTIRGVEAVHLIPQETSEEGGEARLTGPSSIHFDLRNRCLSSRDPLSTKSPLAREHLGQKSWASARYLSSDPCEKPIPWSRRSEAQSNSNGRQPIDPLVSQAPRTG
jgi:hypothetical protein